MPESSVATTDMDTTPTPIGKAVTLAATTTVSPWGSSRLPQTRSDSSREEEAAAKKASGGRDAGREEEKRSS